MEVRKFAKDLQSSLYENVPRELIENGQQMAVLCDEIETFAGEYDFQKLRFNGYRSMVKMLDRFAAVARVTLADPKKPRRSLVEVTFLLIDITTKLVASHEGKKLIQDDIEATLKRLNEFKQSRPILQSKLKYYWAYHALYWMDPGSRAVAYLYTVALSMISNLPMSLLAGVFREYQGSLMAKIGWTGNAFFPLNLANYANNPLTSFWAAIKAYQSGIVVDKIAVDRQIEWIIPEEGDRVVYNTAASNNHHHRLDVDKVTCRVMRYSGHEPTGDVVLHAQGGAFIVDSRQIHEQYLRDWVPKLDGAVIVNVEYSRAVRYPIALQELLDVYLWLIGDEKAVRRTLGFVPRRIIVCGDSAGGMLLFTLCLVLRDIQTLSPDSVQLFPPAFVGFYPALSLVNRFTLPSFYLSAFDAFVSPCLVMNILSLYSSGVVYDSDCTQLDNNLTYRSHDPYSKASSWQLFYNTWLRREKSWFDCEPEKARERLTKICSKALKPYISPLVGNNFDHLSDLHIYLISAEFDPLLDNNIELAKVWKGKVSLDILEELNHGFLIYSHASEVAKMGSEVCLKRIQEALGILN